MVRHFKMLDGKWEDGHDTHQNGSSSQEKETSQPALQLREVETQVSQDPSLSEINARFSLLEIAAKKD